MHLEEALRMPKALCMSGMAVTILIAMLFIADLAVPEQMAPFRKASMLMDIAMIACAVMLFVASWFTFREQV